jgi:hypothetical protein
MTATHTPGRQQRGHTKQHTENANTDPVESSYGYEQGNEGSDPHDNERDP